MSDNKGNSFVMFKDASVVYWEVAPLVRDVGLSLVFEKDFNDVIRPMDAGPMQRCEMSLWILSI